MLKEILDFLCSKHIKVIKSNEYEIITSHNIEGTVVEIQGIYNNLKQNKLPSYFLCDRYSYGLLAHIGWDVREDIGLCCSGSDDVLSINYKEPGKVYYEGLEKALDLLRPTINNSVENNKQIMDEYLGHLDWVMDKTQPKIIFIGQYLSKINKLEAYIPHTSRKEVIVSHKDDDISPDYCLTFKLSKQKKFASSYLLELEKLIPPPIPNSSISDWWIKLLDNQGEEFLSNLQNIINYKRDNHFYFICFYKYNEEIIAFSISCKNNRKKGEAPISIDKIKSWGVSIVKTTQHTREFLLPRSGGTLDFQDKKVLLVGCGSVGSFIAKQIVQTGIGKLILADTDTFTADNLYRHNLSMSYNNLNKADSLKVNLGYVYPYTDIEAKNLELSKIQKEVIIECDLIIIAIGNPTQERWFNEYLKKENIHVNVIYTWLEGYGLGGHAIYVDSTMNNGCLQCNYLDVNEEIPILHSNVNFLYPNQNVTKDIGGCGTLFLPYSHLDAEQTALMTSRMAIDVLSEKINRSVRISWKGSSKDAEDNSLRLTHRYYKYSESKYDEYKQGFCFVCS